MCDFTTNNQQISVLIQLRRSIENTGVGKHELGHGKVREGVSPFRRGVRVTPAEIFFGQNPAFWFVSVEKMCSLTLDRNISTTTSRIKRITYLSSKQSSDHQSTADATCHGLLGVRDIALTQPLTLGDS